jgi:hypothetical protein
MAIYARELIIIRYELKVSPELGAGNSKGRKNLKKLTNKITKKLLINTDKSDNYNINYMDEGVEGYIHFESSCSEKVVSNSHNKRKGICMTAFMEERSYYVRKA